MSPLTCLPHLPVVSYSPLKSPQWRVPTSEFEPSPLQDLIAWRLSCRWVSTLPPSFTRFPSRPVPGALGQPSIGPQRFRPTSLGRSVVGEGVVCDPKGIWHVPSGGRCGGIPEPCSGLSYAWGPRQTHSRIDGNTSPGCNPSRPPLPPLMYQTPRPPLPGTMISSAGGITPTYLQGPPSRAPPRCPFPPDCPPAPTDSCWNLPPPAVWIPWAAP